MSKGQQGGLRLLYGFAGLLALVFCAWLAQQVIIKELRRRKAVAQPMIGSPQQAHDPVDLEPLDDGWGRVVIGAPSGVDPIERDAPSSNEDTTVEYEAPQPEQPAPTLSNQPPPRWPADLELVVRPGQSLSKIAAAEYGRATPDLVERLAKYNGMDNPNKLREGQVLYIPVKGTLLEE